MTGRVAVMTLVEFLTARLDEDDSVARAAIRDGEGAIDWAGESGPTDVHIARHDPARVLADIAAKRMVIELRYSWNLQVEQMAEPPFGPILQAQVNTADAILRTLAKVYADHPDYQQEWKP